MQFRHTIGACMLSGALFATGGLLTNSAFANGFTPYKVKMSRINPDKPIRKSAILDNIREKFPGRILSIRENRSGGPDCHKVRSMGDDGELRIIEVACNQ